MPDTDNRGRRKCDPDCINFKISDLKGYPERRDYAAVGYQIDTIYDAFCMSVQNKGGISLIAVGGRGRPSVPGNVFFIVGIHRRTV